MGRRKLKDMEPWERVEPRLHGMTNEEVEDCAMKMLGQVVAKRIFVRKENGTDVLKQLFGRVVDEVHAYSKHNSFALALGAVAYERKAARSSSPSRGEECKEHVSYLNGTEEE